MPLLSLLLILPTTGNVQRNNSITTCFELPNTYDFVLEKFSSSLGFCWWKKNILKCVVPRNINEKQTIPLPILPQGQLKFKIKCFLYGIIFFYIKKRKIFFRYTFLKLDAFHKSGIVSINLFVLNNFSWST